MISLEKTRAAIERWRRLARAVRRFAPGILVMALVAGLAEFVALTGAAGATGPPGSLISAETMPGAPEGARAYRILYRSTGLAGEPIQVSGVVIAPGGPPPPDGRPVVAWAHPTTGVVNRCAPSLARVFFGSVRGSARCSPAAMS
jgi:hypothetical protein